jgi:hypothetical protein
VGIVCIDGETHPFRIDHVGGCRSAVLVRVVPLLRMVCDVLRFGGIVLLGRQVEREHGRRGRHRAARDLDNEVGKLYICDDGR